VSKPLLDQTARDLLEAFGAGKPTPGAGSAAALAGLLAANLLITVCEMTVERKIRMLLNWPEVKARLVIARDALARLLQEDSDLFDEVIRSRVQKREAKDDADREKLLRKNLEREKEATDLPLIIAEHCLNVANDGFLIFDFAFQAARADTTVAISSAATAAEGCMAIISLNLKSFQPSQWREQTGNAVLELLLKIDLLREQVRLRIERLRALWPGDVNQSDADETPKQGMAGERFLFPIE
jgi:formiminotetrahydrofolate cyclodeaminase